MYKIINSDQKMNSMAGILRIKDNAFIPTSLDNTDYQQYLAWVAEGNEPLPADEVA